MRCANVLVAMIATVATVPRVIADPMSYLDNGVIRLGVDLGKGGTITYLASSGPPRVNVINSHDLGREVQQSYYSGPYPFGDPAPPWSPWPWNPIGAGDSYGNPAPVVEQSNDGRMIYTKTAPLQWALNRVRCECLIEQWITLDGNSVQVRNRLTNNRSDHTKYDAYNQELPAAYTNGTFWRLLTYSGNSPYTNGALSEISSPPAGGGPWTLFPATEHWAAFVNDSGFGLGVFNAFTKNFLGGFAGTPNTGGPADDPTGYIAPITNEILDWNIVFEYDYALVLGTLDQIRAYATARRPDSRPDYRFDHDRQHVFSFVNTTDGGWPINGALRVFLDQNDPYVIGPEQWWQAADVPLLYITAAYHNTSSADAEVFWTTPGRVSPAGSVRFKVVPDGRSHTYAVDLASSPAYQGTITGIRFDPSDGNDPGGYVDIASITWKSPDWVSPPNYQGLWWNAPAGSESGWGINLAHQGDVIFATWFTYGATGEPWWLAMTAERTAESAYGGTLFQNRGPSFDAVPFDPTKVSTTAVGTGTLNFSNADNGSFTYNVGGITQTKSITREVFGTLPSCVFGAPAHAVWATNYQDLWWAAPANSESGWGVNLTHQGDTIFATWFTYDLDSTPLWLSATTGKTGSGVYTGTLYRTTGPAFDAEPFLPKMVGLTPVGTVTLTFVNGNNATFSYTVDGVSRSKPITRQVFRAPGTVCQ